MNTFLLNVFLILIMAIVFWGIIRVCSKMPDEHKKTGPIMTGTFDPFDSVPPGDEDVKGLKVLYLKMKKHRENPLTPEQLDDAIQLIDKVLLTIYRQNKAISVYIKKINQLKEFHKQLGEFTWALGQDAGWEAAVAAVRFELGAILEAKQK